MQLLIVVEADANGAARRNRSTLSVKRGTFTKITTYSLFPSVVYIFFASISSAGRVHCIGLQLELLGSIPNLMYKNRDEVYEELKRL